MSTNIYISQKEIDLWNNFSDEILDKVTGQKVYFLEIDKTLTQVSLYGTPKETVFKTPIQLRALINIITWENELEHTTITERPQIEVYVSKKNLETIGFENTKTVIGNFFIWNSQIYEILTCVSAQLVWGEPEWKFGANISAVQIVNITSQQKEIIQDLSGE